jgi:hypothetical protein
MDETYTTHEKDWEYKENVTSREETAWKMKGYMGVH